MSPQFIIGVIVVLALYILLVRRSAGLIGIGVVVAAALVVFGGGGPVTTGAGWLSDVSGVLTSIGSGAQ